MTEDAKEVSRSAPSGDTHIGKLPYLKPAFRYEGVFETMALACGKFSSTQAQCRFSVKLS